jgi:hypothetical protein
MAQPPPPKTRQSGPQAKPAPKDALHQMKPGGPIKPSKQGYVNPGPTDNLRGVEPNTSMHRGTPNPEQAGTPGKHGDHNPGMDMGNDFGHGVPTPIAHVHGRHSDVSKHIDVKHGVAPGHFARHEGEVDAK